MTDQTPAPDPTDASPIDLVRVRAEIAAEVRARRAAGAYPPGFERELDLLFSRFAPREVSDTLEEALERSEDAAGLDPEIPVASNHPVLGLVKKAMAKLLGWYHILIVQQVTALGVAANHVLRKLVDKVTVLESLTGEAERARTEAARLTPERTDDVWETTIIGALGPARGRVVVAECGTGALLAAVAKAGFDAYGVEPRIDDVDEAARLGLDVRLDDVLGHLHAVAPSDLQGVVLRGCVERLAAGELLALADLVADRVAPGGCVVVASATPEAWGRGRTAVEADLALGRPWQPATWAHVLGERGFEGVEVHPFGGTALDEVPGADAALAANLARISDALFGPESFVLVATRAS